MKRTFLLILAIFVSLVLGVNSTKRILTFRNTSQSVVEAQEKLEKLRKDNEKLKQELEHKKSNEFAEAEIRNKLGLVKEGETVVILPKENPAVGDSRIAEGSTDPNWKKWWNLFFGT